MKIAILTSQKSWFVPYARRLEATLKKKSNSVKLFFDHTKITKSYETVFILSYFRIIPREFLGRHKYNMVVHESALPRGSGWSPLFWQILEGEKNIPIVLFEAGEKVDAGAIYLKGTISLKGHELSGEIRRAQAEKTIELCLKFIKKYDKLNPRPQNGKRTFYRKRTPQDSELDVKKTIEAQFNLLRIVDNELFPAFFHYKKNTYILKIYKSES